jgi:hypothetical protein
LKRREAQRRIGLVRQERSIQRDGGCAVAGVRIGFREGPGDVDIEGLNIFLRCLHPTDEFAPGPVPGRGSGGTAQRSTVQFQREVL